MAEITYREAIAQAIIEEMERDANVVLIGEDVGKFGGAMAATKGVFERFGPKRVIDTPISEAAIIGTGLGAAITGLRPIVEIMFIDFTTCCMDQIVNQVAKVRYMLGGQVRVPLVIRTQGGAGKSYAAQHSQSLEAWFAHAPGLKVLMPATPATAKGLLKSAIRSDDPVIFIEHKILYGEKGEVSDNTDFLLPIGKAEIAKEGSSVTIVAYSRQLLLALEAARALDNEGISAELIDLRTISPLDISTILSSLEKTGRLVVVEEGNRSFGVGAEISARIMEEGFDLLERPVVRVGALDTPIPFAPVLERAVIPDAAKIAAAARSLLAVSQVKGK
jgi:pyruvate/2-oxoglutarate/acetoin dehydrogenase E1 component